MKYHPGKANIALSLPATRCQAFLPLFLAWLLCTSVFHTDNWLPYSVPRILMILITDYTVVKCWSSPACKAFWVRHQVSLKNLPFLVTSCFTGQPQWMPKSSQPFPSQENHEIATEHSSPGGLGTGRKTHPTDLNAKFEIFIIIQFWGQNRALKRSLCTHAVTKSSHIWMLSNTTWQQSSVLCFEASYFLYTVSK